MKRLSTAFAAVMLLVMSTGVAEASPPEQAGGDFHVASAVPTSIVQAGSNCIIDLQTTFIFDGDLVGSFDSDFRIMHFGPCDQPAREKFEARGTYVGEVAGETGSFDFNFQGSIDADGNAEGDLVILNGEDGLANLHGRLTLTGQAGVAGTYSGAIHFDPALQ